MSIIKLNLRFFDGEGAAEGAAPAEGAQAAEAQEPAKSPEEDRQSGYAEAKAKYKAEFEKDFKTQLDDRFRKQKAVEGRMKAFDPVLQALGAKYGVDPSDAAKLQQAIDSDTAYYEQEAQERGLTVEQLRENKKLIAENAQLRSERESAEHESALNQKLTEWNQQTVEAKALYPEIDLTSELNSPETGKMFFDLLSSGLVGVKDAYELVHPEARDARIQRGTAMVAQMAQQKTLDTIKAKGMRPTENGGGMPANGKINAANMTPEKRREINERVMRGEKVDLRNL